MGMFYRISNLVDLCYQNSREKGFWDQSKNIPEKLCLIHSELSEALENYRVSKPLDEELADICIRVFDLAGYLDIDLERAILEKMDKNRTRAYLHGGKRA